MYYIFDKSPRFRQVCQLLSSLIDKKGEIY